MTSKKTQTEEFFLMNLMLCSFQIHKIWQCFLANKLQVWQPQLMANLTHSWKRICLLKWDIKSSIYSQSFSNFQQKIGVKNPITTWEICQWKMNILTFVSWLLVVI